MAVDEPLPISTLHRFREGDAAAFVEIMQKYQPLVRGAVARYFRSEFEREEAMQEIWLHVFRQRETLNPERRESFSGWLAVLSRRRCIDLLRRPTDPTEEGEAAALAWLQTAPGQETSAEAAELRNAVEIFRTRLKPAWRSFFDSYFVEGLDYGEVGKRLSIGMLRCKYMRKVLALRARRSSPLMAALGRFVEAKRRDPS
jgi:RNA polymerase sigma-70 factor (ECF subfamily)